MQWLQRMGIFSVLLGVVIFWQGGCGPSDDCSGDADCAAGYSCQKSDGAKRCIRPACTPACSANQQCIGGRCLGGEELLNDGNEPVVSDGNEPIVKDGSEPVVSDGSEPTPDRPCQGTSCPCKDDFECSMGLSCKEGKCVFLREEDIWKEAEPNDTGLPEEAPSNENSSDASVEMEPVTEMSAEKTPEKTPEIPEMADNTTTPDTSACQKDADCGRGRVCKQGVCEPAPPVVCTPACSANQQCTGSGCVSEPTAGIGEECSAQKACAQGFDCVLVANNTSRCFQPCKNNQDCQQNALRKACYFLGGTQSYCIQEAGNGQACGLTGKIQALCDSVTVCQQGTCQVSTTVSANQRCGVQGKVCPQGHFCLGFPDGSGGFIRYCMKECTYNSANPQSNCAANNTCEQLNGTRGYCSPNGSAQVDDLCGAPQSGDTFDTSKSCGPGLSCVGLARSICLPFAEGDCATSMLQCATGRQCSVITGGGKSYSICSQVCSSTNTCSKPYLACDTTRKLCSPTSP